MSLIVKTLEEHDISQLQIAFDLESMAFIIEILIRRKITRYGKIWFLTLLSILLCGSTQ